MVSTAARFAKRFAILIPGIVIAVLSVHTIFPFIDRRVPVAVAVFATYVLGAYVLVPALIRVARIVFPARHLQSYCVTPDGLASDPVNIGIVGSRLELIQAMTAAGWHMADRHALGPVIREVSSTVLNQTYHTAPVSSLYLFGRKQDIAFEIPTGGRGNRHHVRFWATSYQPGAKLDFGTMEWHRQRTRYIGDDTLWVGAASKDIGISFIRHNVQLTHMIDPDTDRERQLIIDGLRRVKLVTSITTTRLTEPYKLANRAWRGHLLSDGQLHVVRLKRTKTSTSSAKRPSRPRR